MKASWMWEVATYSRNSSATSSKLASVIFDDFLDLPIEIVAEDIADLEVSNSS